MENDIFYEVLLIVIIYNSKYLPEEMVSMRQKEQFSDGVGYNWIDDLKKYTKYYKNDE